MASNYWIKLYHEILDDPKMGRLSEVLFSRCIKFFLLAGTNNKDGELPSVDDMAWKLRIRAEELESDLVELQKISIVEMREGVWFVSKFLERQRGMTPAEKMKHYRERKQKREYYQPVTVTVTDGNADIEEEKEKEKEVQIPLPSSPLEASKHPDIKLYHQVSGVFPGQGDYRNIIEAMGILRRTHPDESELEGYLLPFWLEWSRRKTQDGRAFSKTNPAWFLEWALNNDVPTPSENGHKSTKQPERINITQMRINSQKGS